MKKELLYVCAIFGIFFSACNHEEKQFPAYAMRIATDTVVTALQWKDVQPQERITGQFNPGFVKTAYWLRTTIANPSTQRAAYILLLQNPHINRIRVYENGNRKPSYDIGDDLPFKDRPVKDPDLTIPLSIAGKDSVDLLLWVNKSGESLQLTPLLLKKEEYINNRQQELFIMGLIGGWMLLIICYCCINWILLKDQVNILYAVYVLTITLWVMSNWGIGYRFIWPQSPFFNTIARSFFFMLSIFFFLSVLLQFFPKKNIPRSLLQSIYALMVGIVVMILLEFTDYEKLPLLVKLHYLKLSLLLFVLAILLVVIYLHILWRKGEQLVGYYVAGLSALVIVPTMLIFYQYGVNLPFQPFLNTYGTSISLVIESTIITLGISKRYSHYRKKIQQLSIELLEQEKKISHVLMNIQEEEQRRIGRDLHDALGGLLATALMVLQKTKTKWPVPEKQKIEQLITQSISEMRTIAHNLVPSLLIENGLRYALFNFIDQLNLNQSTHFNLYYDISGTLSTEKQTIMYRICHELLHNISKHAQASEVSLQLVEEQDMVQIIAEDNGNGFDVTKPVEGIGLKNLRQRIAYLKGSLNIDSNENGTTVIIQIPYLP